MFLHWTDAWKMCTDFQNRDWLRLQGWKINSAKHKEIGRAEQGTKVMHDYNRVSHDPTYGPVMLSSMIKFKKAMLKRDYNRVSHDLFQRTMLRMITIVSHKTCSKEQC